MRILYLGPILLLAAGLALAQEAAPVPQPVREGNIERLILDDGLDRDAAAWNPAEANVAVDMQHAKHGDSALRLHIDVNWETGEKNYPVGWPRMNRRFPPALQDWSDWDYLDFSIYVTSSRESLPTIPLGVGLYGAGNKADYNRSLTELKLNQWTDYRLPLSALPSLNPRTGIQFFIAESNYRDGDKLDFWIDNISLVRYVSPTLSATSLAEQTIFADARYLLVNLEVMGVKPGELADVTWQLASGGKTVVEGKLRVPRSSGTVPLPLPGKGLAPGDYTLTLQCPGDNPVTLKPHVVSSPWQEAAK